MPIEEMWKALEEDANTGKTGSGGWLLRLTKAEVQFPLFVGLELGSRRRAILLRLPEDSMPPRRNWPRSKGLEPLSVLVDHHSHFGVALKEPRFADVFTALVEDLVRRVSEATDIPEQSRAFLGQLSRWQKFLSASADGLSDESQRGLWGELHCLREVLLPVAGARSVCGWKGGERAHQDFQFPGGAIEVKTTLAKQPQIVRITSERQLDHSTCKSLFLHVISLDVREGAGESLPAMVASLRTNLSSDAASREQFEDELLAAGYLDAHVTRYAGRGYLVRSIDSFRVTPAFPCLVETQLPRGVGDVNYGLAVAACEPHKVKTHDIATIITAEPQSTGNKRRQRG